MGNNTVQEPLVSSLEQLKTLNDIPGVVNRLASASALCNHAHRADMIFRWLADLLTDENTRALPESWRLLAKAARLLEYSRLHGLLRTHRIAGLIDKALRITDDHDLLRAVHDLVKLLLATPSPHELSFASIISLEAEDAAKLFQSLMSATPSMGDDYAIIGSAIQVWETRRVSQHDDDLFRSHCWYISSAVYARARSPTVSLKRKKTHLEWNASACSLKLERLIARHIYLPCRRSFNQPQDIVLYQPDQPFSSQIGHSKLWDILPTQLDIAVRCTPINTHSQRMKEAAWVDTVFKAILELWVALDGPTESRATLIHMLEKVAERHTLSSDLVSRIIDDYSNLDVKECEWTLVATLIKMNGQLFTNDALADRVFAAVGRHDSDDSVQTRQKIVLPLCKLFAANRRLDAFLSIWQHQIARTVNYSNLYDVDECLVGTLDTAMTTQRLGTEIALRIDEIAKLPSQLDEKKDIPRFWAASIILSALFRGVQQVNAKDAVAVQAGAAFDALLAISRSATTQSFKHVWRLATISFKLWFPHFAMDMTRNIVTSKSKALLGESLINSACRAITSAQCDESEGKAVVSRSALEFVACLCDTLHHYDGCSDIAVQVLQRMPNFEKLTACISYPSLAQLEGRKSAAGLSQLQQPLSPFIPSLLPAPWFTGTIDQLLADLKDSLETTQLLSVLQHLLSTPAQAIRRDQREKLIDTLVDLKSSQDKADMQLARLALLVKLLRWPATVSLFDDAETVWRLCYSMDFSQMSAGELTSLTELVSTVVNMVCIRWTSTLDLARSKSSLQTSLTEAGKVLSKDRARNSQKGFPSMLVASALLQSIAASSTTKNSYSFPAPMDDKEDLLSKINHNIASYLSTDPSQLASHYIDNAMLCFYLEDAAAAMHLPNETLQHSAVFSDLQDLAAKVMTKFSPEPWSGDEGTVQTVSIAPAVPAYCILCLNATSELALLAHAVCRLLSVPFSTKHRYKLKAAYRQAAQSRDSASKYSMIEKLLSADIQPSSFDIVNETLSTTTDNEPGHPAILASILKLTRAEHRFTVVRAALGSVSYILRHTPSLVNQYGVDLTLSTIHHLARPSAEEVLLYPELCAVLTALLTHHRTRLNGRFHILMATLQALLARLLTPNPPTTGFRALAKHHAAAYSRVITLLCEPPVAKRRRPKDADDLVDRDRRTRANVGSFVQTVLHSYCTLILRSPPRDGVREALLPAIASMLSVMEIYSSDSIKVLSSAMTDSERGVLRGLVEQWRLTNRWTGI